MSQVTSQLGQQTISYVQVRCIPSVVAPLRADGRHLAAVWVAVCRLAESGTPPGSQEPPVWPSIVQVAVQPSRSQGRLMTVRRGCSGGAPPHTAF